MERKFDNFDEFADDYRDTHDKAIKLSGADSNYFSEYKIETIAKIEKKNQAIKFLDFGCGDGNSCVYIRKYFPKAELVGIDVSAESIEIANQLKLENTKFESFNGIEIPYESNSFDIIFTSMVLHHIGFDLHLNLLKEIRRVLTLGGRFYIFEHNPYNPLTRKIVRECVFDEDAILLSPTYCENVIKESGFATSKTKFTIFLPRHKFLSPFFGIEKFISWLPIGAQYFINATK